MKGWVDGFGRALVRLDLLHPTTGAAYTVEAWIDTGCVTSLLLPATIIQALGLPWAGIVPSVLADGSKVDFHAYTCLVSWFGQFRKVQPVSTPEQLALLGIGLLKDHRITIDYSARTVRID